MQPVSILLNILWILIGGAWMAFGWLVAAVIMAITIIGLPWARAAFNIAVYTLLPFGSRAVRRDEMTGESDIVAHLVLAHQTQAHNLITLTNYRARQAIYTAEKRDAAAHKSAEILTKEERATFEKPAEELVEYLLFANEAPLDGRVKGYSGFTQAFEKEGPRDRKGRSLRDFDLKTRLFRYPCSYLIYSESFDTLPDVAKQYVYHRLYQVLSGQDTSPAFAKLSSTDRKDVLEILRSTKHGLPEEWQSKVGNVLRAEQHPRPRKGQG